MVTTTPQLPPVARDHRVVLSGISWEMYEQLVDELERAGRRLMLTYDGGELEIEMPSGTHEFIKVFVRAMLEHYLLQTNTPHLPAGQTTFKRRLAAKGVEPDESYYLSNLAQVSQARDNNFDRVPPPDLAIEVEVSAPLLDKLPVYASIGIPELWHVDASGRTRILRLHNGGYQEIPASVEVPFFTPELLSEWIARRLEGDYFQVLQTFRQSLTKANS